MFRSLTITTLYLLAFLTFLLYFFGVSGPLLLDDFQNLESLGYFGGVNSLEGAQRFIFGNSSGPFGRPVAMASFLLNDFTWPLSDIASFKLTNIAFHICTGLVLFLLINRLLWQEFNINNRVATGLSIAVVATWLIHPIHVSTVLYIIQRMAILSAFFSLCAFLCYLHTRFYIEHHSKIKAATWSAFGLLFFLLAILSKENAILLIPFILLCEFFLFRPLLSRSALKKGRVLLLFIMASSPIWLYLSYGYWGGGYAIREFDVIDRLILQIAVIGDYVGKLLFPTADRMNLLDGRFISLSSAMYSSSFIVGYLISFTYICLFIYASYKKNTLLLFGLVWFVVFHVLESSVFPLEIYYEHRNYLPSVGLFIFLIASLYNGLSRVISLPVISFIHAVFLIYLGFVTLILAITWGVSSNLFIKLSSDEPNSLRAKVMYAAYLERRGLPEFAIAELEEAMDIEPAALGLVLNITRLVCKYDLVNYPSDIKSRLYNADMIDSSVVFQLRELMRIKSKKCAILGENFDEIDKLIARLNTHKVFTYWPVLGAQYFNLLTDYYVSELEFNSAMRSLDKAIELTPTVDLLIRKSVLLASAGLYEDALETLRFAHMADTNRKRFTPSREEEIKFLMQSISNQGEHAGSLTP